MKYFVLILCLLAVAPAVAADRLAALSEPGVIAIMRHALAPGGGDPAHFELGDCTTQRNLDASGRDQARRIGAAIRAAGVQVDRVVTSQWCRCRETAELLGLGPVEGLPALNSFFEDRAKGPRQTEELRAFLAALPPDETVMLVTHQVNITALTGNWVDSGEVFLLDLREGGQVTLRYRVLIEP